jgi:hypothetical protein
MHPFPFFFTCTYRLRLSRVVLQIVEYDVEGKAWNDSISKNQTPTDPVVQTPYKYDFDNQTIPSNEYICYITIIITIKSQIK